MSFCFTEPKTEMCHIFPLKTKYKDQLEFIQVHVYHGEEKRLILDKFIYFSQFKSQCFLTIYNVWIYRNRLTLSFSSYQKRLIIVNGLIWGNTCIFLGLSWIYTCIITSIKLNWFFIYTKFTPPPKVNGIGIGQQA